MMNELSSFTIWPSLIVIRTTSNLSASLPLRRALSKGSVQEGSSSAPNSLQDMATRVHWTLASFEPVYFGGTDEC